MALPAAAIAIKQGFIAGARSESKFLTRSSLMEEDTGDPVFFSDFWIWRDWKMFLYLNSATIFAKHN
jgi:hypothetical protein